MLWRVALETSHPLCALYKLGDGQLRDNQEALYKLRIGEEYYGRHRRSHSWLYAGSRAESLTMEEGWGHPLVDFDGMDLYGGPLGVHVPHSHHPPRSAGLVYRPEGCPPAYTKIEVGNGEALKKVNIRRYGGRVPGSECIHREGNHQWLHAQNTLLAISGREKDGNISGPAGQLDGGLYEVVPTLICSTPHPSMAEDYLGRNRKCWPSQQQLEYIARMPMLLVLVGHKTSEEFPYQARISWSHIEMHLIAELSETIKQVYVAVKCFFKRALKPRLQNIGTAFGRSHVNSYHLKTVLLHHIENVTPPKITSQFQLALDVLQNLDRHIESGQLPHYFLPECNLLETVGQEERDIARQAIKEILSDPLTALLTSPTSPREIYGDITPGDLVEAFRDVSSHPDCVRSCQHLRQILTRLDEWREERFREQLQEDMHRHTSTRSSLRGLVAMFDGTDR